MSENKPHEFNVDRKVLKRIKRGTPEELDVFITTYAHEIAATMVKEEAKAQLDDALKAGFQLGYETFGKVMSKALNELHGFGEKRINAVIHRINELNVQAEAENISEGE